VKIRREKYKCGVKNGLRTRREKSTRASENVAIRCDKYKDRLKCSDKV
jgi:hypothetical protein